MKISKKLTKKFVKYIVLIENYLNSIGLDVSIKRTVSNSINGDWVEISFLTEKYNRTEILNPSNFEPLFEKTFEKTSLVLSISFIDIPNELGDVYGELYISSIIGLFKKSDYYKFYKMQENLNNKIKNYIESGINIEIRKKKLSKI